MTPATREDTPALFASLRERPDGPRPVGRALHAARSAPGPAVPGRGDPLEDLSRSRRSAGQVGRPVRARAGPRVRHVRHGDHRRGDEAPLPGQGLGGPGAPPGPGAASRVTALTELNQRWDARRPSRSSPKGADLWTGGARGDGGGPGVLGARSTRRGTTIAGPAIHARRRGRPRTARHRDPVAPTIRALPDANSSSCTCAFTRHDPEPDRHARASPRCTCHGCWPGRCPTSGPRWASRSRSRTRSPAGRPGTVRRGGGPRARPGPGPERPAR